MRSLSSSHGGTKASVPFKFWASAGERLGVTATAATAPSIQLEKDR